MEYFWALKMSSNDDIPRYGLYLAFCFVSVAFFLGFSDTDLKDYGDTYRLRLHRKTEVLEFTPDYTRDAVVLWKRDDTPSIEDSRQKVRGGFFVIYNLTQEDSGKFIMRDKNRLPLVINRLLVEGKLS